MQKFNRRYQLFIEMDPADFNYIANIRVSNTIVISDPLTITFDVSRSTSSDLNSAEIKIYNLSESTRKMIFQDYYKNDTITRKYRKIILKAGYGASNDSYDKLGLPTIFIGDMLEAYSYRENADIITHINAQDGGYATAVGYSNFTVAANTSAKEVINNMQKSLGNITRGNISNSVANQLIKGSQNFNGNTFALLKSNFKDMVFIDLNKLYVLKANEAIKGYVPTIISQSGLLSTPMRRDTQIIIDMLFEPTLLVGQVVNIDSSINDEFDGQYKVEGIRHHGTISGAIGGECRTTLQLFRGNKLFTRTSNPIIIVN